MSEVVAKLGDHFTYIMRNMGDAPTGAAWRDSVRDYLLLARELEDSFDEVLNKNHPETKFQVQQEMDALKKEIENKDKLIAKVSRKLDDWEQRLCKVNEEQEQELTTL